MARGGDRAETSWKACRLAAAAFGFSLLYIPLVCVAVFAVYPPVPAGNRIFTLAPFAELWRDATLFAPLSRSIAVGCGAALAAGAIGTAAALATERARFPGRRLLLALSLVPLAMPEIVLGISSLIWFAALRLQLGLGTVLTAHVTFCISYVYVTVLARIRQFDRHLEEAAMDLGASPRHAFWKVTFPLILPGVVAGALLAFVLSFDDFLISYFVTGIGTDTLPIKLYSMMKFGLKPTVYALATLLILATAAVVALLGPGAWIGTIHDGER
jgi:spermidine/putrescine transport system permease protein